MNIVVIGSMNMDLVLKVKDIPQVGETILSLQIIYLKREKHSCD